MKKITLTITICLLFLSCSSDSSDSQSGLYKWRFKLNGVLYEWEGNHLSLNGTGAIGAGGQSTYSVNSLALQKINSNGTPLITLSILFPNTSSGDFVFNSSNFSNNQAFSIILLNNDQEIIGNYSSAFGGNINLNISSLSTISFTSNPSNPGKVIGTFSGTVSSLSPDGIETSASITDGYFEAVRAQ
jgi:hypothetical protein